MCVTWKDGNVAVVPKSDGIPRNVDNYFDPDHWDQSNPERLVLEWFTILACGMYDISKMKNPHDVFEELEQIDEFYGFPSEGTLRKGGRVSDGDANRPTLKDFYIVWKCGKLSIVPRTSGEPEVDFENATSDEGSIDPDEWISRISPVSI